MENHDLHPMIILKLKQIPHCKKCYTKLQNMLLEVDGVYAATIDEEKKLVSVRGKIDPWVLIKAIEENGNAATLLSYEKQPQKKNYSESSTVSGSESIQKKKSYGFWKEKDKKNSLKKNKKERQEVEHKIEDYVPQKIDPEVCRDQFCKVHKRRPIILNSVPSRDSENHPHHTGMGIFPGAHQLFPEMAAPPLYHNGTGIFPGAHQLFPEMAAPPLYHTGTGIFPGAHQAVPPQYHTGMGVFPGAHQVFPGPEVEAPPPHSGFYSRRPVPHSFNFYGRRNPGNCTMM